MLRLLLPLLLLLPILSGCRRPVPQPAPQARILIRFLDQDAVLTLPAAPPMGSWHLMNAGQWEPLDLRWTAGSPRVGATVIGRTAPDWVLLEDPSGESHRIVMRGPGPEGLRERNAQLDPGDVEALSLLGILWALTWSRH